MTGLFHWVDILRGGWVTYKKIKSLCFVPSRVKQAVVSKYFLIGLSD